MKDVDESTIQKLIDAGYDVRTPHPETLRRRAQREKRVFPVISRSGRTYVEQSGREYGEGVEDQRDADAGSWGVGQAVRRDLEPMTVAVAKEVKRIYEVHGWTQNDNGKWTAELGRLLTNEDLDREYPDYPYRIGDYCRTQQGRAYRPETY
jgi:hypothetical protein